jgi:hypothetical protein
LLPATQIDAVARRAVRFVKALPPGDDSGIGQWPLLLWKIRPASLALATAPPLRSAAPRLRLLGWWCPRRRILGTNIRRDPLSGIRDPECCRLRLREQRSRHDKHRNRYDRVYTHLSVFVRVFPRLRTIRVRPCFSVAQKENPEPDITRNRQIQHARKAATQLVGSRLETDTPGERSPDGAHLIGGQSAISIALS